MRIILFLTVWDIGYLVNCPIYKLQALGDLKMDKFIAVGKYSHQNTYKLISKYFAPNTRAEILVSFYKDWA